TTDPLPIGGSCRTMSSTTATGSLRIGTVWTGSRSGEGATVTNDSATSTTMDGWRTAVDASSGARRTTVTSSIAACAASATASTRRSDHHDGHTSTTEPRSRNDSNSPRHRAAAATGWSSTNANSSSMFVNAAVAQSVTSLMAPQEDRTLAGPTMTATPVTDTAAPRR